MRKLIEWLTSWFVALPGEDGVSSEYEQPARHDPERITRLQFDDDFRIFERHGNK